MPSFTSWTGLRARQRQVGPASAQCWKGHGFANLEKIRAARSFYAARRRESYQINEKPEYHYGDMPAAGAWRCDCGRTGDSTDQIYPFHLHVALATGGLVRKKKRWAETGVSPHFRAPKSCPLPKGSRPSALFSLLSECRETRSHPIDPAWRS